MVYYSKSGRVAYIFLTLLAENWNVAYRFRQKGLLLEDEKTEFKIIKNSFRYWAADPFVFNYKGETYIFAELYDYIYRRGIIGFSKFENGNFSKWKPIITESYHLSFPCIFSYKDEIYIMPESSQNNNLYLYKAKRFPYIWEKQDALLNNIKLLDTIPFEYNNCIYAFTLKMNTGTKNTLHLLKLESNEIKLYDKIISDDDALTRMAGRIICIDNRMLRVSQNCEYDYGTGINFSEFSFANMESFEEKLCKRISFDDINLDKKIFINGLHTYNINNDFEVIDVKSKHFNLLNFIFRLINKLLK